MFACSQSSLGVVVVSLVGGAYDDKMDLGICADILNRAMDGLWRDTEAVLDLAAFSFRVTLENGVKLEVFRESQDEGYVECQASQSYTEYADIDGLVDWGHDSGIVGEAEKM